MNADRPPFLCTAQQSRDVDYCAITEHQLPGPVLMARAARAAFGLLLERMNEAGTAHGPVQILCGTGNNGGDGLLLSALLRGRGVRVRVFLVDGEPRSPDGILAAAKARAAGVDLEACAPEALERDGFIVDAMLGTGISGEPRAAYARVIDAVNELQLPVLALDVPSGVDSDTGHAAGSAIRASWTLSFITAKRGLYTAMGETLAGDRYLHQLEVPSEAYEVAAGACSTLDLEDLKTRLPLRDATAHKGRFGRCLLLGGDRGMGGAIILAAEAALRTGVGLARVGTRPEHLAPLLARRPESMGMAVNHRNDLNELLPWADAIVLGPGLGQGPWAEQLCDASLSSGRPLLVDADGLNLLARRRGSRLPAGSILTPHPGEAARLLGISVAEVQADRFTAAKELAARYDATVILKGNGSIVCCGELTALCTAGNAGMASGGMGDVLSGIGGALLAQGLSPWDAARLATVLHGAAADRAVVWQGLHALLAADLLDHLGELLA